MSASRPLGSVYIHWPYCSTICSYCNFNKYRNPKARNDQELLELYRSETRTLLDCAQFSGLRSVYFGGGTPSLAPVSTIEGILSKIREKFGNEVNAEVPEVSLEVNPSPLARHKLRDFKSAGITRLSVGVQSLNDTLLRALNRDHSSSDAIFLLQEAGELFPDAFSADMIFGLPGQTTKSWLSELRTLMEASNLSHVSLYQLTLERGTPICKAVRQGEISLPIEEEVVEMYESAMEYLSSIGMRQYEVSNFAKLGAESQHNLHYWLGGNYIGIGPGSHSRFLVPESAGNWIAAVNAPFPADWKWRVRQFGHGMAKKKLLEHRERFDEVLATSLRTHSGLSSETSAAFGLALCDLIAQINLLYPHLLSSGLLKFNSGTLSASGKGLSMLDSILPSVLLCAQKCSM